MLYFDINRMKALYGVDAEKYNDVPDIKGKKAQVSSLGKALWNSKNGKWEFMPVTLGGVELWNPIIRITARKTVVETPMVEQEGSVKEIISLDDYIINIRGIIKTADGTWPNDEIAALAELWKRKEAIPIFNAKTAHFLNGNENVVITNLTIPESPGKTESEAYEIECVSDIAFSLELDENGNSST